MKKPWFKTVVVCDGCGDPEARHHVMFKESRFVGKIRHEIKNRIVALCLECTSVLVPKKAMADRRLNGERQ